MTLPAKCSINYYPFPQRHQHQHSAILLLFIDFCTTYNNKYNNYLSVIINSSLALSHLVVLFFTFASNLLSAWSTFCCFIIFFSFNCFRYSFPSPVLIVFVCFRCCFQVYRKVLYKQSSDTSSCIVIALLVSVSASHLY